MKYTANMVRCCHLVVDNDSEGYETGHSLNSIARCSEIRAARRMIS